MFLSTNSSSSTIQPNYDPLFYPDHPFFPKPFLSDITFPESRQDHNQDHPHLHPPISFFHFPSPFDDHNTTTNNNNNKNIHHDLLHLHNQTIIETTTSPRTMVINPVDLNSNSNKTSLHNMNGHNPISVKKQAIVPRKRSSKRDRHSKINTLQGPRDRRMRLSLPVAREFFGLQDILGVDKGSKTVEWLLMQARPAIKKLAKELNYHSNDSSGGEAKSPSSLNSEGEVMSGSIEEGNALDNGDDKPGGLRVWEKEIKKSSSSSSRSHPRKTLFHHRAKESREKARERARARTKEKKQIRTSTNQLVVNIDDHQSKTCNDHHPTSNDFNRISTTTTTTNWSAHFANGEESVAQIICSNMNTPSMQMIAANHHHCHQVEEPICSEQIRARVKPSVDDDCLVIMSKWSPSSVYYSLHNHEIPHEHQFGDLQFY